MPQAVDLRQGLVALGKRGVTLRAPLQAVLAAPRYRWEVDLCSSSHVAQNQICAYL
jgi:hypothetical protein